MVGGCWRQFVVVGRDGGTLGDNGGDRGSNLEGYETAVVAVVQKL